MISSLQSFFALIVGFIGAPLMFVSGFTGRTLNPSCRFAALRSMAYTTPTIAAEASPVARPPLVITGPSGVGKGTIIQRILKSFPNTFAFTVSHTTRGARPGEVDGVHYNFVFKEGMAKAIAEGLFAEYAEVHGNLYGTSVQAMKTVAESGKICILDIDMQGVKKVRTAPGLRPFFVLVSPPSFEALEKRLRGRRTESEEALQIRLRNAQREMQEGVKDGMFDIVLVNDDLDRAVAELELKLKEWYPTMSAISTTQAATTTTDGDDGC